MSCARTVLRIVTALVLCGVPAATRDALAQSGAPDRDYLSATHGFRLRTPAAGWVISPKPDGESLVLTIGPPTRQGAVAVTIRVKPAGEAKSAKALRELSLAGIAGQPQYRRPRSETHRVAGQKAPAFSLEMTAQGQTYRVRQAYLLRAGRAYTVACHAPAKEFDKWWPLFSRAWGSFAFTPLPEIDPDAERWATLAERCSTEVTWMRSWAAAAQQARTQQRLVLVVYRQLSGFKLADPTRRGIFMDPDVIAMVRHRLVAWRFERGQNPPFERLDGPYGLGSSAFGTSVLLVTPDGDVVSDTGQFEVTAFRQWLRDRLAEQTVWTGPGTAPATDPAPDPASDSAAKPRPLARAAWHLARGELSAAAPLLEKDATVAGLRLRADLLRRERKGTEALAVLQALRRTAGAETPAGLVVDEAVLHLRLGEVARATTALKRFVADHAGGGDAAADAESPKAAWLLGVATLHTLGTDAAKPIWNALTVAHPDSRWAWQAAAVLQSVGFTMGIRGRVTWPDAEVLASIRVPTPAPLAVAQAHRAEQEVRTYLLRVQRDDGSWIDPTEAGRAPTGIASAFTVATTAICGQALLAYPAGSPERAAALRARTWLLAALTRRAANPPPQYFMDYTNWSDAFALWFLADCVTTGAVPRAELRPAMRALHRSIAAKQRSNGGWSYYLKRDLAGGNAADQSISFVTAAVVLALAASVEAGAAPPAKLFDDARTCLAAMRTPGGTFAYFLYPGKPATPSGGAAGAAGRGPLCANALLCAGRGSVAEIQTTMQFFLTHRAGYAKQQGRSVMHCGPQAQGSHYLLFDYAMAARALQSLPAEGRAPAATALLELVLAARGADGSFVDNPLKGWHYGAGMALQALQRLRAQ